MTPHHDAVQPVCATHPDVAAELVCTACQRWSCDACAKPLTEGRLGPRACTLCRGILRVGDVARRVDSWEQLGARLGSADGAVMVAVLSLPGFLVGVDGPLALAGLIVWIGVLGGYFFQTVDHIAANLPGLPFSSDVMFSGDILAQVARAFGFVVVAVGPAAAAAFYLPDRVPLQIALLLLGVALAPASLLASVFSRSLLQQLWPPGWLEIVQRAPKAYGQLVAHVYGSMALGVLATMVIAWVLGGLAWLVLPIVHTTVALWIAGIFGRHLQAHGEAYGVDYGR